MSQTEIASNLGVNRQVINNWLRGKNYPSDKAGRALARLLGVSFDYLITGKEIERHEEVILDAAAQARAARSTGPGRAGPTPTIEANDDTLRKQLAEMFADLTTDPEMRDAVLKLWQEEKSKKPSRLKAGLDTAAVAAVVPRKNGTKEGA